MTETTNRTAEAPHVITTAPEPPESGKPGGAARRFRRRADGLLAGVCGGVADLLGIDVTLVRVGLVAATVLGFGTGILLYLACWVIVPQD
ncbi:PspC domain-containing protein [Saccharopolyspora sp. MS10]|uniref:PspC domain-containing protein n=1 Tax=Saccharopolyspora sp. MS10 TaxID=3385973 RepID=UPI0039A33540